jgi:hypothetical protein
VAVWGRDRGREMVLACSGDAASHMMRTRGGVIKNSIGRSVYIYIYIYIYVYSFSKAESPVRFTLGCWNMLVRMLMICGL